MRCGKSNSRTALLSVVTLALFACAVHAAAPAPAKAAPVPAPAPAPSKAAPAAAPAAASTPSGPPPRHATPEVEKAVESQAEVREKYKEQTEEIEHALAHTARFRNAIAIILSVIVVMSVAFELGAERMQEHVSEKTKPVIDILFKELTVLGFIALFVFLAVETGIPQQLSDEIFGTPSELKEMFEFIHFLLFLIIVFYLVIVAIVITRMLRYERNWRAMESLSLKSSEDPSLTAEEAEYVSTRQRFVEDKITPKHKMDRGFPFCEYLVKYDGHLFEEIVELNPTTWAVVLILVAVARLYMMLHSESLKLVIFIAVGFLTWLASCCMYVKLQHVQASLTGYKARGAWLLNKQPTNYSSLSSDEEASKATLPYQRIEPPAAPEGWLGRFLYGDRAPTQQENLLWFKVNGVGFLLNSVRTVLFMVAIYTSLLWVRFANHFESAEGMLLFLGSMIFPSITVVFMAPAIVAKITWITGIEEMRKHRMAALLQFSSAKQRSVAHIKLVYSLRALVKDKDANCVLKGESAATSNKALATVVEEVFHHYDQDKDGFYDWAEFSTLTSDLGLPEPAGVLAVRSLIEGNGKFGGDDDLSKEEVIEYLTRCMGQPVAFTDAITESLMAQAKGDLGGNVGSVTAHELARLLSKQVSPSNDVDSRVSSLLLHLDAPIDVMGVTEAKGLLDRCVCAY